MCSNAKNDRKGLLFIVAAFLCWSLGGLCISFIPWGAMSIIGISVALGALLFVMIQGGLKIWID